MYMHMCVCVCMSKYMNVCYFFPTYIHTQTNFYLVSRSETAVALSGNRERLQQYYISRAKK